MNNCSRYARMLRALLWLGLWSLVGITAHALTASDVARLRAGATLKMPLPDADESTMITVQVQKTRTMRDEDGTVWQGTTVKAANGDTWELLIHPSEKPENMLEVVVDRMKLRDLGLKGKDMEQMEKQHSGSIQYEGQTYQFNWDESEDTVVTDAKGSAPASVYRFDCMEDDDYALLVFEWDDGKYEVLHTQWLPTAQVTPE